MSLFCFGTVTVTSLISGIPGILLQRKVAAFAGAYDAIPSIAAAYSSRRLRTAYTGSLLRIRRSSDNTESDIGALANGDLDTAAAAAFVGGGNGYIVTWYDQSGNGYDASQTTAASQPLYVASGQNGRPVGRWDGVNDQVATANNTLFSGLAECEIIAIVNCVSGSLVNTSANGGASLSIEYNGNFLVNNTGLVAMAFVGNWEMQLWRWSAGATAVWRNGAVVATNTQAGTTIATYAVSPLNIGNRPWSSNYLSGDIAELIICNAALSDANRQAAETAANSYWAVY